MRRLHHTPLLPLCVLFFSLFLRGVVGANNSVDIFAIDYPIVAYVVASVCGFGSPDCWEMVIDLLDRKMRLQHMLLRVQQEVIRKAAILSSRIH